VTALLDRPRQGRVDLGSEVRLLLGVAFGPAVVGVAVLAAAVLTVLVASGIDLARTPAVVAVVWLAAHQVPVTIDGAPLGVLPLLPTAVLGWATLRGVVGTGVSGRRCARVLAAAVLGPVLLAVAALGTVRAATGTLPLSTPDPARALAWVVAVHLTAGVIGVARPSGYLAVLRRAVPRWMWVGVRQVPMVLAALLGAGVVLTIAALAFSASTVIELVGTGGGAGGGLGLLLLSLAYLPNVAVGAVSITVGPGAFLGQSTVTAFGAVAGPVPALPLLAVLPQSTGSWWWPVVLGVPAAVAVLLGWRLDRGGVVRTEAVFAVVCAAVMSAVVLGALGVAAGGSLGTGVFTPVGVPALALAGAALGWLAVVGSVTVYAFGLRVRQPVLAVAEPADTAEPAPAEPAEPAPAETAPAETAEPAPAESAPPEPAADTDTPTEDPEVHH